MGQLPAAKRCQDGLQRIPIYLKDNGASQLMQSPSRILGVWGVREATTCQTWQDLSGPLSGSQNNSSLTSIQSSLYPTLPPGTAWCVDLSSAQGRLQVHPHENQPPSAPKPSRMGGKGACVLCPCSTHVQASGRSRQSQMAGEWAVRGSLRRGPANISGTAPPEGTYCQRPAVVRKRAARHRADGDQPAGQNHRPGGEEGIGPIPSMLVRF